MFFESGGLRGLETQNYARIMARRIDEYIA